jgi:hypothetical protein
MQKLRILPTNSTPEIILEPEGMIKIRGRSMYATMKEFTDQTDNWIIEYLSDPADITYVDFHFEYVSTNNLIFYRTLLEKIAQVILRKKKYVINWIYDEGDIDIIEKGENISSSTGINFNFIMISDPFIDSLP